MKRKIIVVICIVAIALFAWRYIALNQQYPSPPTVYAAAREDLDIGGYRFSVIEMEKQDGSYIESIMPNYFLGYGNGEDAFRSKDATVLLADIRVTKLDDSDEYLDLTSISFEIGAWSNQFDKDVYARINEEHRDLYINMRKDESITLTLPIVLTKDVFVENNLSEKELCLVLAYYPVKYVLLAGRI